MQKPPSDSLRIYPSTQRSRFLQSKWAANFKLASCTWKHWEPSEQVEIHPMRRGSSRPNWTLHRQPLTHGLTITGSRHWWSVCHLQPAQESEPTLLLSASLTGISCTFPGVTARGECILYSLVQLRWAPAGVGKRQNGWIWAFIILCLNKLQ